tara:strand:- start:30 stop:446 length:417 start_codon:yes stop_codon:yes gene_type:complete
LDLLVEQDIQPDSERVAVEVARDQLERPTHQTHDQAMVVQEKIIPVFLEQALEMTAGFQEVVVVQDFIHLPVPEDMEMGVTEIKAAVEMERFITQTAHQQQGRRILEAVVDQTEAIKIQKQVEAEPSTFSTTHSLMMT